MKKQFAIIFIIASMFGLNIPAFSQSCTSSTCNASSPSESDFLAALPSSGNTNSTVVVNIPPGNASWTGNITYTVPASVTNLTIQGATTVDCTGTPGTSGYVCSANDNTVIRDSYAVNGPSILKIITGSSGTHFRMTGLTFEGGSIGSASNNKYGVVAFAGSTQNLRFDHIHINNQTYSPASESAWILVGGPIAGVMDHNLAEGTGATNMFVAFNTLDDSIGLGDGTWAAASGFGTSNFLFMESNYFSGGYSNDCNFAGKFVSRYNFFHAMTSAVQTHATKSTGGPERGCRAMEIYHNYVDAPSPESDAPFGTKIGPAMVWGNTMAPSSFYNLFAASTDRSAITPETNTPNGWGYCGTVQSPGGPGYNNGVGSAWDGNINAANGYPCLDGVGRGQTQQALNGALQVSRLNSATGTIAWPKQYLEPVYLWNNTIGSANAVSIRDSITTNNRDIYYDCGSKNSSCSGGFTGAAGTGYGSLASRPSTCAAGPGGTYFTSPTGSYGVAYFATDANSGNGELYVCTSTNTWTAVYQPYTYPHPLVSGNSTSTATPPAPTNLVSTVY
jgi:hypothetical protein